MPRACISGLFWSPLLLFTGSFRPLNGMGKWEVLKCLKHRRGSTVWGRTFLELHFLLFPFFCFFSSSCFILVFVEKGEVLGLQIMSFQTQENKARCLSNHRKAPPPDAPQFPRGSRGPAGGTSRSSWVCAHWGP